MKEKKTINLEIGQNVKHIRENAGLTQERLAELIGLGVKHLSAIECGAVGVSLARVCNHTERRGGRMSYPDVPIWEKYTLTIEEAAKYFRIGEKKLRKLVEENSDASWLIMNGNRVQIKRRQFEKVIDSLDVI